MKIRKANKGNVTVITFEDSEGSGRIEFLYSYQTFVACCINGKYYRDETRYSVTTSKHITQWSGGSDKCATIPADTWASWVRMFESKWVDLLQTSMGFCCIE